MWIILVFKVTRTLFHDPGKGGKKTSFFWRNLYLQVTVNPPYMLQRKLRRDKSRVFMFDWEILSERLLSDVNFPMILVNKRLDYCREKFWGRITLNTALNIKPYFWIENVFLKKIKKTIKSFVPFASVVWTVEKLQSYVELVEQNKTDRLFGFHIQIKGLGHKRGKQLR